MNSKTGERKDWGQVWSGQSSPITWLSDAPANYLGEWKASFTFSNLPRNDSDPPPPPGAEPLNVTLASVDYIVTTIEPIPGSGSADQQSIGWPSAWRNLPAFKGFPALKGFSA
jgi:hypothetical protein